MIYAKNNVTNEITIFPQDDIMEGYTQLSTDEVAEYELQRAKDIKIAENDRLRDEKLAEGVTYKNVLFYSNTDEKINLFVTHSTMSDEDTITWYGKDNQGLLCDKADLLAIGGLITRLHNACRQTNAYIKEQIEQAESIEELEAIVISY